MYIHALYAIPGRIVDLYLCGVDQSSGSASGEGSGYSVTSPAFVNVSRHVATATCNISNDFRKGPAWRQTCSWRHPSVYMNLTLKNRTRRRVASTGNKNDWISMVADTWYMWRHLTAQLSPIATWIDWHMWSRASNDPRDEQQWTSDVTDQCISNWHLTHRQAHNVNWNCNVTRDTCIRPTSFGWRSSHVTLNG